MRRQPTKYHGPTILGIDVSHHQGTIYKKFKRMAELNPRIRFCFCRTGDGIITTPKSPLDPMFYNNWVASKDAGWVTGSYHYFRADRDGAAQADLVLEAMHKVKFTPGVDIPPAIDWEDGARKNLQGGIFDVDPSEVNTLPVELVDYEAWEFVSTIEKELGVHPLIYTGQTFHWWMSQARPELAKKWGSLDLWTPWYGTELHLPVDQAGNFFPWKETDWTFWQYDNKARFGGFDGPLDANKFRGDWKAFKEFLENTKVVPDIDQPEEDVHLPHDVYVDVLDAYESICKAEYDLKNAKSILNAILDKCDE
jgi:lysozyme